ncbi:alpha/beta hydrolase [Myxococcota bacterium]|nr:alpha/beta hydrolase [Myxococcota bacterium]
MKTAFVTTTIGRLSYSESQGRAPGAFLVHGNSGSRHVWDAVLGGTLGRRRRLVALDLPGHGDSTGVAIGEGVLASLAAAVGEAAASLGLGEAVGIGHSLGGHLLLEARAAGCLLDLRGLGIHGAPPLGGPEDFGSAFRPSAEMATVFEANPETSRLDALLDAWYGPHCAAPPEARTDFSRTQADLRPAIATDLGAGRIADERAVVSALSAPIAIFNGADDPFINVAYLAGLRAPTLWRGSVQVIERCGHFPQWERPDDYGMLLDAFLRDVYGD